MDNTTVSVFSETHREGVDILVENLLCDIQKQGLGYK